MEENKVIDINENRIVITNMEVMTFANVMHQQHKTFQKLQNLVTVSGKLQYWVFKLGKKINDLFKDIEEVRIKLAKEHCKKDKKGEPAFSDSKYKFSKENEAARQTEIQAIDPEIAKDNAFLKELDLKYCDKDEDGDPIMMGGNNLSFTDEGMIAFQKAFAELMEEKNVLNINRIKIDSALLEKINNSGKGTIDVNDMIVLDKFFDFVE